MKQFLSKSPILILVVLAGLVAGTALVAGYVDRPNQAPGKCLRAPLEDCCAVDGVCGMSDECPVASEERPCGVQPAAGCPFKAQTVSCPATATGCPMQAKQSPCGPRGCPITQ